MVVPGTGPVVVVGRMAFVVLILKLVKLMLPWQISQAALPTGMWVSGELTVGEAPQDDSGIGTGW
jgi:hypothetical protein